MKISQVEHILWWVPPECDIMAVGGVLFGPVCGVMYLIEIKNGVLNIEDDENGEE